MTAIRARRTRTTIVSIVVVVVALVLAGLLGIAGVRTLADSTAGQQAEGQTSALPTQRLPYTSTALVGTLDEDGRLTSVAVMTLEPDGTGGSIVELAASADSSSGNSGVLTPFNSVLEVDGAESFVFGAETLTGLSYDVIELVDPTRFTQLITPLGDLTVRLPNDIRDASSDESWEAGDAALSSAAAARALTATDPSIADWYFEPTRAAVWGAVADRVGAGIGSAEPVDSDDDLPVPRTLDEFVDRLFAGPVTFRALAIQPIDEERVDEQLPDTLVGAFGVGSVDAVSVHDRAETLMVMGAVAPGRMGAPLDAPNFRIVSGFTSDDLDELDLNNADVLKRAIDGLIFTQVNVVSVADLAGDGAPDVTRIVVAHPSVIDGVEDTYGPLFGEIEVVVAEVVIEGVDIEVMLGLSYLDHLGSSTGGDVAGSAGDASDETDDSDGDTSGG